jgi:HEAT repeat protein
MRCALRPLLAPLALAAVLVAAPTARAEDSLDDVVDRLVGPDSQRHYPAYTELQRRRDPAVVPLLVARLDRAPVYSQSLGVSLLQQFEAQVADPALEKLLDARSPFLRGAAAIHLHPRGHVRASRVAVEAFGPASHDPLVLQYLLGRLGSLKDAAIQSVVRGFVVPGADAAVVGAALTHLAYLDDREVLPALRELVGGDDVQARALAAAYLLERGEEQHVGALVAALDDDALTHATFVRVKPWLVKSARLPESLLEAVMRRAERTEGYFGAALVELLAAAGHAPAVPLLRRLMAGEDEQRSKAAFEALAALPGGLDDEALAEGLTHVEPARRLAAADILRRRDDLRGLPVALELAVVGSAVRQEAVRVLGGFRHASVVEPLIDALTDPELTTRANAYNALGSVLRALYPYRRFDLAATGYVTSAPEEDRRRGQMKLRAWWKAHGGARW